MKTLALAGVLLLAITAVSCHSHSASMKTSTAPVTVGVPHRLRTEYLVNPIGLTETSPRLSWELQDARRGARQTSYQIIAASSSESLDNADLWDTGKVESSQTHQIVYAGKPLTSASRVVWRVRTWDADGNPTAWSQVATFELGLLSTSEWKAKWIADAQTAPSAKSIKILSASYESLDGSVKKDVTDAVVKRVRNNALHIRATNHDLGGDPAPNIAKLLHLTYELDGQSATRTFSEHESIDLPKAIPQSVPLMRKSFLVSKPVVSARLYVTARGLYDIRLNGKPTSDTLLAPEWTDYRKRQNFQSLDVTPLIRTGPNALAAQIAHGWYSGQIGNGGFRYYGESPSLLAQLHIRYADGTTDIIPTDETWKTRPGPITSSDFMKGENHNAQAHLPGWDSFAYPDTSWTQAAVVAPPETNPVFTGTISEPVRELMTLPAKSVSQPSPGKFVFDLGQNMVGVARLTVSLPPGVKLTLRHAEFLNPDGTLYTTNLRGAPSIDTYITSGTASETWQPRFTFHGFRYVELSGLPANSPTPPLSTITGVVIGSDTPQAGTFSCSDPRLNQLQSNIVWGQRGNFLSVPTDCPQRDERLGWTGDAQVFIGTAVFNADVAAFFTRWLLDMDDAQTPDGKFTDVVPDTMGGAGVPGWGDAGVICPWVVYRTYGDTRVLKTHLPAMIKWIEWCKASSTQLIRDKERGPDYGDWLAIGSNTPKDLLGTAYFAYSTRLTAKAARIVGDTATADRYDQLFADICKAFVDRYLNADGTLKEPSQTGYALALHFDLLPESLRPVALNALVADIKANGNRLSTGFLGVSYLLPTLSDNGQLPTAYALLLQDAFPSWLFSVKHGATTIWERWDGWTPDKGFQNPGMNSFNHYALGSCGQWLFENLAGIQQQPDSAGYEKILIAPKVLDTVPLTHAKATYHSIHGPITSAWTRTADRYTYQITIPPNTTATLALPTPENGTLLESGQPLLQHPEIQPVSTTPTLTTLSVPSGSYTFTVDVPKSLKPAASTPPAFGPALRR